MYKVAMVTLGCPKNQVDAEIMLGSLRGAGFELVGRAEDADAIIVNTCGFIESAKQESIDTLLEMAELKKSGVRAIICTGCLAERYRNEITREMPEVDVVVGIGCNGDIADITVKAIESAGENRYGKKGDMPLCGERVLSTPEYWAYLKIADGCDNRCTYCAIPMIRGGYRSRPMEDIAAEAEKLAAGGARELILIAQDTTRYGLDLYGRLMLPELLRRLCGIDGVHWIRMLYCYPDCITDELIDVIAAEDKILPYIDLPLQHCSGDVLKRMNRRGDKRSLLELIEKLRSRLPDVTLRTTFITGFPGESEGAFEELCDFVREVRFDRLGCFTYSAEEGTPAAEFEDQIDEQTKQDRQDILMREQMRISEELNREKTGKAVEVLCEGYDPLVKLCFGRTAADSPEIDGRVFFTADKRPSAGEFVRVKITDPLDYDLLGELIGDMLP